jgi:hypothetical protein
MIGRPQNAGKEWNTGENDCLNLKKRPQISAKMSDSACCAILQQG